MTLIVCRDGRFDSIEGRRTETGRGEGTERVDKIGRRTDGTRGEEYVGQGRMSREDVAGVVVDVGGI